MEKNYRLTTQEILNRCGIRSGKTLTRWRKLGLLPRPLLGPHSSGRGKVAYYAAWVPEWILALKNRLANGESLEEIAQTCPTDWAAEEKRQVERETHVRALWERSCRAIAAGKFGVRCSGGVYTYLRRLGIHRPGIAKALAEAFSDPDLTGTALELLLAGNSPILVLLGDTIEVIPDSSLTSVLSHPRSHGQPMLVIPIHELLVEEFSSIEPKLPKSVKAASVTRAVKAGDSKKQVKTYKRRVHWRFDLE